MIVEVLRWPHLSRLELPQFRVQGLEFRVQGSVCGF